MIYNHRTEPRKREFQILLFYVRHGDPIYDPDQLTPLGRRQADAVARRLALFGIDKLYSSDSIRAMQTAQPTCELLNLKKIVMPCFNEALAYGEMKLLKQPELDTESSAPGKKIYCWPWSQPEMRHLLLSREIRNLGDQWYTHPEILKFRDFRPGIERIANEADAWLASIGYHHDRENACYTVTSENPDERIALFAHEGVGKLFLSHILDIPFPLYSMHYELEHTGMTVIEFRTWKDGLTHARVLTHSNDSHLYKDGLPLDYQHHIRF